jgi:hypothetical protein
MKNAAMRILGSCAVAALVSPAMAETLTWGNLNIEYGKTHISGIEGNAGAIFDRNPESLDISGSFGAQWAQFGAQVDLSSASSNSPLDEYTGFIDGNLAALHLNYDLSTAKLGVQYGEGSTRPGDDDIADFDFYALEGTKDFGNFAVSGQWGRFDSTDPDETDAFHNGKFLRVSGVYSLGDAGAIEAELGFFDGKQDNTSPYDMSARTWGVKYSRQFGAEPFAWSVGFDGGTYTNGDVGDNGTYDDSRVSLGLTTWFGDDTLAASKKRGILGQPDFARIVGAGNNVD